MALAAPTKTTRGNPTLAMLALAATYCLMASLAFALPRLIPFQGKITDESNVPFDGPAAITFSIYEQAVAPTAGPTPAAVWTEQHTVTVQDGQVNVILGSKGVSLDGLDFVTKTFYLGIKVANGPELAPRQELIPSFHARVADQAKTVPTNAIDANAIQTGAVNTSEIADGEVKSADIGDGTVASIDITDGTIAGADIADGTVTGTDIADDTITGADVGDGKLALADTNFAFGSGNTRLGNQALGANTTGATNTAMGNEALRDNTTGTDNTAVGEAALRGNTTGSKTTALGERALIFSNGDGNTGVGWAALNGNGSGTSNTAVGLDALVNNNSGSGNIALGIGAGSNLTTGNNNIMIGNPGVASESNSIRIGNADNATARNVVIQGIHGAFVNNGTNQIVVVDSTGKLGTMTSSARFKENIQDMGDASGGLLKLRPVTFRYKHDFDPSGVQQYGLVAEEVADVLPNLVVWQDGKPLSVGYHHLIPMLLNELQKQHQAQATQAEEIRALRTEVTRINEIGSDNATLARENAELRERLTTIEQAVAHLTTGNSAPSLSVAAANRRATPR